MATITLSEHAPTHLDDPLEFRAPNGEEGGVEFSLTPGGSYESDDPFVLRYAAESVLLDVDGEIPPAPALAINASPEALVEADPIVETTDADPDADAPRYSFNDPDGDN